MWLIFRMDNRMEYSGLKVLKKNKLNSITLKADFNRSIHRRDTKSTEKLWDNVEKNIEKVRDIMVAEELFNTRVAHMEGDSMFFEVLHLYIATPGTHISSNHAFNTSYIGLLTKEQLNKLREELTEEWKTLYFDMEMVSWDEWQRDMVVQNEGLKVNAVGNIYKKIMRELIAEDRVVIGANEADYKANSKEELNRWVKKLELVKPIIKILNRFDLTIHEMKIRNFGRGLKIVKIVMAVKTKDDGFYGGWDVLNYEHERLKEEWKVEKMRNKTK